MKKNKTDYGLDAPGLVAGFFGAGAVSIVLFFGLMTWAPFFDQLNFILTVVLGLLSTYLVGMGTYMFNYSKFIKSKDREKLLNCIEWSGTENVLDVSYGRRLMLIGATHQLTSGTTVGIDL